MLELNKEYTYREIIEVLGWEEKAGNSKKAQIKEIESAYEFYHPMNKKTHKEKKSYIFTKQLRELVEPSKGSCGGSHNTKNITPMIAYMQAHIDDKYVNGDYYSMTDWYCEILGLLNKEICTTVYMGEDVIDEFCDKYSIHNRKLFCDYVSAAKSILKDIFLKSLANMEKRDLCEYDDGYIFIYQMSAKKVGWCTTHTINDLIITNETTVCNDLKEEYNLSDKLKGRQLLMQIYNSKNLTEAFNELKVNELMCDDEAIKQLNKTIACEYCDNIPTSIDSHHPLLNYYRGVALHGMEFADGDKNVLAKEVCTLIRDKTLKAMYAKGGKNMSDKRYYIYNEFEHGAEMDKIADLLFIPKLEPVNDITMTDDEWAELDMLFGVS